jgi:CBS domain-containing protein
MTTSVVSVDRITPYKEIARLLTEHRISGVPVLSMGRHVVGVVSEADLLAVEDERTRRLRAGQGWLHLLRRGPQNLGLTAGELMTAPAVTVQPDTPVPSAARVVTANHLRRLPVVDEQGKLIGIVTRRDLLSAFLRPDAEIAADVAELLDEVLHAEPTVVKAVVHDGRVILTGITEGPKAPDREMVPTAIRLIWDIDGVIDVDNRLGQPAPAAREHAKAPHHVEAH